MPVAAETLFESAVTESNKDTCTGSCIEDRKTVTESDMRKKDWQKILKTESGTNRYKKTYRADVHEFSTFRNPIIYRFITARGYYPGTDGSREYFTPEPSEVSPHHHMSGNIIRPACFFACCLRCDIEKYHINIFITFPGSGRQIMHKKTD
ncbi:MAG: hypothetical protein R2941_14190 [Desulfobacterales bacterium]